MLVLLLYVSGCGVVLALSNGLKKLKKIKKKKKGLGEGGGGVQLVLVKMPF